MTVYGKGFAVPFWPSQKSYDARIYWCLTGADSTVVELCREGSLEEVFEFNCKGEYIRSRLGPSLNI